MENKKYFDAVDIVCMECAFTEKTCSGCPVRMTVDHIRTKQEEEKEKEIRMAILRGMFK